MTNRYHKLLWLLRVLYEAQPQAAVSHPYKEKLAERLGSPGHVELADLLIRQITLLNRMYRMRENGVYRSEQQDLVIVINLLHGELKTGTMLNPLMQLAFSKLKRVIGYHRMFTRKDVQRITGYRKTQSYQLIKRLEICELIKQVGGSKTRGYYYEIIRHKSPPTTQ